MRLYSGTSPQFIKDTTQNQIAEKLKSSFFDYFHFNPSPGEINSWRNSLRALSLVFQDAKLLDHGVLLEYQLPLTSKRLDCMITGRDENKSDHAVIIELKQWEKCEQSECENEVITWVGGSKREVLHPSVQVGQYKQYLLDSHTAFYEGQDPVKLEACSYLHNYPFDKNDVIFTDKFLPALGENPLFTLDDVPKLSDFLSSRLAKGQGIEVLTRVEESKYRPSKKLMEHVGNVIKGKSEYVLLDEQLIVYDKVLARAKQGFHNRKKTVLIVKGGPGTGKSVIAINLMADLLLNGFNAHYATGSKAFTETLKKIVGSRGSAQFKYFNSYGSAQKNEIDILICDEAHRIRETSFNRFIPREKQSGLPQIQELLNASKVVVFFIDDAQVVRPNEIGSVKLLTEASENNKCDISEYELEAQFRCGGSDAFVNWISNTLSVKKTANVIWDPNMETFDFKIFDTPESLEQAIRDKVAEGFSGRVSAGFCWNWSKPNKDGTLVDDVVIGNYKRPWNANPEATRLASGIPKASLWAHDPNGINQIGCVYTAQGFEYDYSGVIIGKDLTYNFDKQTWEGTPKNSFDTVVKRAQEKFIDLVKHTYRILLSRGMKGCYVYFIDKDTERFFRSRMETPTVKQPMPNIIPNEDSRVNKQAFKTLLPVYSLKAAAGYFGKGEAVEPLGWVEVKDDRKLEKGMFVAQVVGKSMEPKIKDGSYCVFRENPQGTRQNKIVLVQHTDLYDPETGGSYTVKRFKSVKESFGEGSWRHAEIQLIPENKNFHPIVIILKDTKEDEFKVVAEFLAVI